MVLHARRWSTLTLLSVSVVLGAIGYFAGRGRDIFGLRAGHHLPVVRALVETTPAYSAPLVSAASVTDSLEEQGKRWCTLVSETRTPAGERAMAALIEQIATNDHARALTFAAAEPNWRLRILLRDAALRGWASVEPSAAAHFAFELPECERRDAVSSVLAGAANDPKSAAEIAMNLCARDPALAGDHGRALIDALSEVGAFSTAARFAEADSAGHSAEWLNRTFYHWAARQPAAALAGLDALATTAARQKAFQGLALGWSMADPTQLAAYAVGLPAGDSRSLALRQALDQWVLRDPAAAANWVDNCLEPGADADLSAATLATLPTLVAQRPEVALSWAQSIVDPALRESTFAILTQQWAARDRTGAKRFIEHASGLLPEDRGALLKSLDTRQERE